MKIRILSDLHNEFGRAELPPTKADVVVLAGDVDVGIRGVSFAQQLFGEQIVLYVAGNHEYYGHGIPALTHELRAAADRTNVRYLEKEAIVINGVRFLGTTLWTDFNLFGPARAAEAMTAAGLWLNDFRQIKNTLGQTRRFLNPEDALELHAECRTWLANHLAAPWNGPSVVVTHHAPSRSSVPRQHLNNVLSAAFTSDLEQLITEKAPDLWIHGHTHHCVDYRVGKTRVVSNQRGYPHEPVGGFTPGFVVDLFGAGVAA
jgi:predicted phosphodiesterase